jgi:hypothetical protein
MSTEYRVSDLDMAQAFSHWPVITEASVRFHVSPFETCGAFSGTAMGVFPELFSVFPVTVIPLILHIHSFYHQHFVILAFDHVIKLHTFIKRKLIITL